MRRRLSIAIKRHLEEYYGAKLCVVTGTEQAEYHHLDDNDSNSTFANLIPLAATFNCPDLRDAKARAGKSPTLVIHPRLEPESLLRMADENFGQWKVPQAYGCARLAYFVAKNYFMADSESRLPMACAAMYFARHTVEYDLIRDILVRDLLPMASARALSMRARAMITQELAGILSEHGRYKDALHLFQTIPEAFLTSISSSNADKYAGLLRRQATSIIAENGSTPRAKELLTDAQAAAPHSENIRASIANTLGWSLLSGCDYKRALDILAPLEKRYRGIFTAGNNMEPINITAWNAAEIFHNYGIAACNLGGRHTTLGVKALERASRIYRISRSRPFMLRERMWEQVHKSLPEVAHGRMTDVPLMRLPPDIDTLVHEIARCVSAG